MTEEYETSATSHPALEESEAEAIAGELGPIDSADTSMAGKIPNVMDVTFQDGVDAVKWGYHKFFDDEKKPEPGGISVDLEDHEETTMRSSSTAHEDPPPPPPGETSSSHETEHRDY
jgi:hypothetical protein